MKTEQELINELNIFLQSSKNEFCKLYTIDLISSIEKISKKLIENNLYKAGFRVENSIKVLKKMLEE